MVVESRILAVDDKMENLVALENILKKELGEIEIIKAMSGNEALGILLEKQFVMAILDVQMPLMDGYELAEIIRQREELSHMPIIFLSAAYSDSHHIFKGYESGAVDFITKPFNPKIFISKVRVFIQNDHQRRKIAEKEKKLAVIEALAVAEKEKTEALQQAYNKLSKAHNELESSSLKLKEATAQIIQAEKLASLGELTAGVAHELSQPLNIMTLISQGIVRDIRKNRLNESVITEDLNEIVSQVDKMAEIIDHMRIYTRRSDGMETEFLDMNFLMSDSFKFIEEQLKSNGITVQKKLSQELPVVKGDRIRLEQVFLNLITNAKHAVEKNGKAEKIILVSTRLDTLKKAVIVDVTDNGAGMSETVQEKIFESFFTTKEAGKGTGLGLSISRKIIEEHQGRLDVKSTVAEGSTFSIILPLS